MKIIKPDVEFITPIDGATILKRLEQFSFDDEYEIYRATLKNADGDELEVEGDTEEFKDMVVGIEIAEVTLETRTGNP